MLQTVIEIKDHAVVTAPVSWTEDHQMVVDKSAAVEVPNDFTIISISQVPKDRLVQRDKELKLNASGTLETDENGETTMPGVFASGDVVTGAKTVVAAVNVSKMIADDMDKYMQGLDG